MNSLGVPLPTIRRLPFYLRIFREETEKGSLWLSSEYLGERLGLGAIQVRKDLASIGAEGRARCGFPVRETTEILRHFLGSDDYADVFLVGSGDLAAAVFADRTLQAHGFRIIAVFDSVRIGSLCAGHEVLPLHKLPNLVCRMGVKLAIFALSGDDDTASALETIGASDLQGIFDFSGLELNFPDKLLVEREDIGARLARLAGSLGAAHLQQQPV
jgi:redox-sensing transcriptional repressor